MDLERIREYLIQRGMSPEELDEVKEPRIVKDIGEGLTLSLINDEAIGSMVIDLFMMIDLLEQRVAALEGGK